MFSIVTVGHVNHGKSTLCGKMFQNQQKFININEQNPVSIMDTDNYEKEKGVTVDVNYVNFKFKTTDILAFDVPGHQNFIQNSINAIYCSDVVIVVISSVQNELIAGFSMDQQNDTEGSTRQYFKILKAMNVKGLVIALNKQDQVKWDLKVLEKLKAQVYQFVQKIFSIQTLNDLNRFVKIVPISAKLYQNIDTPYIYTSESVDSKCLLDEVCDMYNQQPDDYQECILSIVYDLGDRIICKVVQGRLKADTETLIVMPSNTILYIKSVLDMDGNEVSSDDKHRIVNRMISVQFRTLASTQKLMPGNLLLTHEQQKDYVHTAQSIIVSLNTFLLPKFQPILIQGTQMQCHLNGGVNLCYIKKFQDKKIVKSFEKTIRCILVFAEPISFTKYEQNNSLGNILLRCDQSTLGYAHIMKYLPLSSDLQPIKGRK